MRCRIPKDRFRRIRPFLFTCPAFWIVTMPTSVVFDPAAAYPHLRTTAAFAQMPTGNPAEEYGVRIARVKYGGGGDWYSDPSSLPNWLSEFGRRTGIRTNKEEKVVSLTDENLRAYPSSGQYLPGRSLHLQRQLLHPVRGGRIPQDHLVSGSPRRHVAFHDHHRRRS